MTQVINGNGGGSQNQWPGGPSTGGFASTPGIASAGPPAIVGCPNIYDSTNVQQTVAALYTASQAGGLGPPSESGGVIQTGDVQNPGSALTWSGASLVTTGAPSGQSFPGNSGAVVNWNHTTGESSTEAALADLKVQQPNPTAQPAQNAPVTYNGTAWANAGSYKFA
jgi:hypothetical protein